MGSLLRDLWRIITLPFRMIFWIFRAVAGWIGSISSEFRMLLTEEVEDEPLPDTFAKVVDNPSGLLEHVDALRKHLLRAVLFLAITVTVSFAFTPRVIDLLAEPIGGIEALTAIEVTESLGVYMRVSLLLGFILALPYIAFELWRFAAPGLHRNSRFVGLFAIPLVLVFFLGGIAFAYYLLLPTALPFLVNFLGITTNPRPSNYINFTTGLMFWIGISFQFPLVIYVLARMGIIQANALAAQWRLAVVVIAVVAAVITPTVDPISMALVMGPLIVLYFLSIGLAGFAQRGRESRVDQ